MDLDAENNLPTAYQAIKLIIVALITLALFIKTGNKIYFPLALFLGYLGFDEWFQYHELISDISYRTISNAGYSIPFAAWILAYIPVFVAASVIFYLTYKTTFAKEKNVGLFAKNSFIAGVLCYVSVPLVEIISTWGWKIGESNYYILVAIEEGLELIGTSLLLSCFLHLLFHTYKISQDNETEIVAFPSHNLHNKNNGF